MEQPKIQVTLPPEYEKQLYQQFLQLANQAVKQATENIGISNKRWLNETELKSYIGIGQDTLNNLLEQGLLTYSKVGRQKLYSMEDVERAIEALKF
ncbi:helix-turn-helix domain-containing protein [Fundicoccus sp. Sow4_H7]|uniref:helix-turn-helix domain-containing protein n=1 Tax=Fundicoccus sp. Sow4_H7 TaxID=3438784 RepID=UPI003F8E07DE